MKIVRNWMSYEDMLKRKAEREARKKAKDAATGNADDGAAEGQRTDFADTDKKEKTTE